MHLLHKRTFLFLLLFHIPGQCHIELQSSILHEFTVSPGETIQGNILLYNSAETAHGVNLYQTDYRCNAKGENFFDPPGTLKRSNAKWISITSETLIIPSKTNKEIKYSIKIPNDTSLTGTYWSIVTVEPSSESILSISYCVQLITHIQNSGDPALKILHKEIQNDGEKKTLYVDIENAGTRLLYPYLSLDVIEKQNTLHFETPKNRLYPTSSYRYAFDISSLKSGEYKATIEFAPILKEQTTLNIIN